MTQAVARGYILRPTRNIDNKVCFILSVEGKKSAPKLDAVLEFLDGVDLQHFNVCSFAPPRGSREPRLVINEKFKGKTRMIEVRTQLYLKLDDVLCKLFATIDRHGDISDPQLQQLVQPYAYRAPAPKRELDPVRREKRETRFMKDWSNAQLAR